MADISGVNNTSNVYTALNKKEEVAKTDSQSDMFMQLMIAQLKHQDPTSPAETGEFMQQISDMNMVEGISNLNSSMESFTNSMLSSQTALQASSLVGQKVLVPVDTAQPENGAVKGIVALTQSEADLQVSVFDGGGALVDSFSMGTQAAGDVNFEWPAPAGRESERFRFEVNGQSEDDASAEVFLSRNVDSVTLGVNGVGMKINVDGGSVSLDQIKQIG